MKHATLAALAVAVALFAGCASEPAAGFPKGVLDTQLFVANPPPPAAAALPAPPAPGRLLLVVVSPDRGFREIDEGRLPGLYPMDWPGELERSVLDQCRGNEETDPPIFSGADVVEFSLPAIPGPDGFKDLARRHGASLVLAVSVSTNGTWESNGLAIFDLLILPAFFSPGHTARSYATVEGVLFDPATGRILLSFKERGEAVGRYTASFGRERALRDVHELSTAEAIWDLAYEAAARTMALSPAK